MRCHDDTPPLLSHELSTLSRKSCDDLRAETSAAALTGVSFCAHAPNLAKIQCVGAIATQAARLPGCRSSAPHIPLAAQRRMENSMGNRLSYVELSNALGFAD